MQGLQVEKIYAGGQFSAALCRNGALYTWGKGMGYRYVVNAFEKLSVGKLISRIFFTN